nr:hypothetical protein [Tanacetum cinerariifolium]
NQATVQDGRVVVQNVQGRPNRGQGMNPRGGSAAGYREAQNRVGNVNQGQARPGQARTVKYYNCNGGQDNAFDNDAEDCDAFDSDVDEAPTTQTMFMANLSSVDPITDEAEPSYDSDILSENKVSIGYKNPLCLTRAKEAQPALYNGHEILKDNHAPAKVHNTEEEPKEP